MKKLFAVLILAVVLALSAGVGYAADKVTLGKKNFSVKVAAINFDDKNTDDGIYVGAEGYTEIDNNLYLGAEVGYTSTDGKVTRFGATVDTDVIFLPIEVNIKYAVKVANNVVIDFGVGGSYSYTEEEISGADSTDEWLFGGQIFGDINAVIGKVFLGVNSKMQVTDKGNDTAKNYSNWRIGGQIGIMF